MNEPGDNAVAGERPVRPDEVFPFAKSRCPACAGSGAFFVTRNGERGAQLCGCAVRRFLKARKGQVIELRPSRELHWRVGCAP